MNHVLGDASDQDIDLACVMATALYAGRTDLWEEPYCLHAHRAAQLLHDQGADARRVVVAYVHGIAGQHSVVPENLATIFGRRIGDALASLYRHHEQPEAIHFSRLRSNTIALDVKAALLADQIIPEKVRRIPPRSKPLLVGLLRAVDRLELYNHPLIASENIEDCQRQLEAA